MVFSPFVWRMYKESDQGRQAIARDMPAHADAFSPDPRTIPFEYDFLSIPMENGEPVLTALTYETTVADLREQLSEYFSGSTVSTLEEAEELFISIVDEGIQWERCSDCTSSILLYGGGRDDPESYDDIIRSIQGLTAGLHEVFPEFFFPYLFARGFDRLQRIADRFALSFPDIPGKFNKRDRALFYLGVNREIQRFRKEKGLSPRELNAFFYDFAGKEMGETPSAVLPRPSRVWFLMGGANNNGDFEFLDDAEECTVTYWQGNLEARRGDAVLMWCVSPRSSFHSVWRVTADGFNDPYFFFYTMIRIGHPVRIPGITFADIASHPLWGKAPAVRAHFQGCSGMSVSLDEYNALIDIIRYKGGDIFSLPEPPETQPHPDVALSCEHDVESHLVEPLLQRMGFTSDDWKYQYSIRMGRGERNVPDYILGMEGSQGSESAVVLIEVKFHIVNTKSRKEAFIQGRSYALRLQCSVLTLAASEGFWVYLRNENGFDESRYMFFPWRELEHPDIFARINCIIGSQAVEAEKKIRRRRRIAEQRKAAPTS